MKRQAPVALISLILSSHANALLDANCGLFVDPTPEPPILVPPYLRHILFWDTADELWPSILQVTSFNGLPAIVGANMLSEPDNDF